MLPAVIAGEGWHSGVVGIVAGRLRERWRKPVVVIGLTPINGIGKGSGRSQAGYQPVAAPSSRPSMTGSCWPGAGTPWRRA